MKIFLFFFLLFSAATPLCFADERPNVLLILSDDHNYRALGCSGNDVIRTPNLDRLASEGVYFNRCFTPNPICGPARACIYTGQDSWTNGCISNGNPIRETSPLFPELLAGAGYETAFVGKWHNDGKPWTRGFTTGGRCWAGGEFNHFKIALTEFGKGPESRKTSDKYSTEAFADDAVKYLEGDHRKSPFLLVLAYTVGHDPFAAPPGYEGKYPPDKVPVPPNFMPKPPFKQFNPTIRDETVLPYPRTKSSLREAVAEYYAMIEHMDAHIGRLLKVLKEKKIDDNTIVIFASVKGESLGSHGIIGKQTMYEEGLRSSLIIKDPGRKAVSKVNSSLVSTMDIFPTICEAAGVEIPESVEGQSFLGLYDGSKKGRKELFFSYHDPRRNVVTRAVRTNRYKLIQHVITGERELFDLSKDPIEMNNLIGKSETKSIASDLEKTLNKWREGPEGK